MIGKKSEHSDRPGPSISRLLCLLSPIAAGFLCPHWFSLITVAIAALPWIRQLSWRFNLRTLLIATTLVAVVLGLAVYMASE